MRKFVETIQSKCECEVSICQPILSYDIEAHVEDLPAIGRRLIISIRPPLNSQSRKELFFDDSMLPEEMVRDWCSKNLSQGQTIHSFKVISSDKHERTINILN